jgi:hypothetical protein
MNLSINIYLIIWSILVLAVCFLGEELISQSSYITVSTNCRGVKNIFICFKFLNVLAALIFTISICSTMCVSMCHAHDTYPDRFSILTLLFLISNTVLMMLLIGLTIDSYTPDLDTSNFGTFNKIVASLSLIPIIYFINQLSSEN